MCSVAQAVAPSRPIWTNDPQLFAYNAAIALFNDPKSARPITTAVGLIESEYRTHLKTLIAIHGHAVDIEALALSAPSFCDFQKYSEIKAPQISPTEGIYNLFLSIYSNTYFGVEQSMEIDSIRRAVDVCFSQKRISSAEFRLLLLALGRALLRVATTTGHFAQFLTPSESNFRKYVAQRRRSVWRAFLESLDVFVPMGDEQWRKVNMAFNNDALNLLNHLKGQPHRPGVVYADPPYTSDQYSRYYHLLETLILYDYPKVTSKGRYREQRFQSTFCLKAHAARSLNTMVEASASLGADLVLSYPTNGLVYRSGVDVIDIMRRHYHKLDLVRSVSHHHSTMGASKGVVKAAVTEQIFVGRS
jgi:adenine-specific DNA-methyltransferase